MDPKNICRWEAEDIISSSRFPLTIAIKNAIELDMVGLFHAIAQISPTEELRNVRRWVGMPFPRSLLVQ
jgi:hypothetical protein